MLTSIDFGSLRVLGEILRELPSKGQGVLPLQSTPPRSLRQEFRPQRPSL